MVTILAVVGGGLVGSLGRSVIAGLIPIRAGGWPVATLIVNLAGSLLLGAYLVRRQRVITARWSLHFWAIGLFGSLTTFSAFSIEVVRLVDSGRGAVAGLYVVASIFGGLIAEFVGESMARAFR